jgi:hypothetical protein
MVWRRNRRGLEQPLWLVIVLIVFVIVLLAWGMPTIRKLVTGTNSLFVCTSPDECMPGCPDGYIRHYAGDSDCAGQSKGATTGAIQCCEPLALGEGEIARAGDIRVYYNNDRSHFIPNGGVVDLKPAAEGVQGTFSFVLGSSLAGKRCYGQFSWGNSQAVSVSLDAWTNLMGNPFPSSSPGTGEFIPQDCGVALNGKTFTLNVKQGDYRTHLGQQLTYTLFVVNADCNDWKTCNSFAFAINANIPDRHPAISLTVDGNLVVPGVSTPLTTGTPHTFNLKITDPLDACSIVSQHDLLPDTTPITWPFPPPQTPSAGESCFNYAPFQRQYSLTIPATVPGGIPFNLVISTQTLPTMERVVQAKYLFQVAPEQRIQVLGPPGSLTKEKVVTVTCTSNVACSKVVATTVKVPVSCGPNPDSGNFNFASSPGNVPNTFTFTFRNESEDGQYVCVKALTSQGDIYSLGLWNGQLNNLTIDHTPPVLTVSFDSIQGVLTFTCMDPPGKFGSAYVSGCKSRPFSYAYVTDPLQFAAYVITGGALADKFNGCPNPDDTQHWQLYNSDKAQMQYLGGNKIQVICVRATDNAGNSVVQSKLLFSAQEVLAAFLTEWAKKQ